MTGPKVLPPPEQKAAYVRQMFGRIARRYDLMNRLMALGRDRSWRRFAVAQIGPFAVGVGAERGPQTVLDVATGTGDLALEVLRQYPEAEVTGLDFTPEMLALAQVKANEQPDAARRRSPSLVAGDALHLPFPDASFDGVVTGFALRNVIDIPAAFAEMARVTRPGGRAACLEFARLRLPLSRALFNLYFSGVVPLIGGLISGQRSAYTYLPHSLAAFLTPDEIAAVMRRTGWREVSYRRLMLGTVAVHSASRE